MSTLIEEKTIRKIADLSRIALQEEEIPALVKKLGAILAFVEQLGEVDTTGVAPLTSAIPQPLPRRADKVTDGGYPEDIVKNAPQGHHHFFSVPKVVE